MEKNCSITFSVKEINAERFKRFLQLYNIQIIKTQKGYDGSTIIIAEYSDAIPILKKRLPS